MTASLTTKFKLRDLVRIEKTTASTDSGPLLVPPSESTSTPASRSSRQGCGVSQLHAIHVRGFPVVAAGRADRGELIGGIERPTSVAQEMLTATG